MMVARIRPGPTLRVIFERADGHIESALAVDGPDARDLALMIIGRVDELRDGDKLTVRGEWK
jgi:hypothetical protein